MSLPIADLPLFTGGSAALLWFSQKALRRPGSHGFWRFFAWESMLGLIVLNRQAEGGQVIAQSLLLASLLLLGLGFIALRRHNRPRPNADTSFYDWENTGQLVTHGIYRLIRHPMYASLLALNWGMFFRATGWPELALALLASYFLQRTALADERECIDYFGKAYVDYMARTKRFVPWLI